MPSILKYFMKPRAEEYQLPNTEDFASQLEEMVRLKESVPHEESPPSAAEERTPPPGAAPRAAPESEADRATGSLIFARDQANELLRNAQEQAERIVEQAKMAAEAEVVRIHQQAAEEGYAKGYADGQERGRKEAAESINAVAQQTIGETQDFLERAAQKRDAAIDSLRDELLDVAVAVAEKVIHVSLKSSEEIIKRMISSATEKLKRREWVQIYVADADIKGRSLADPALAATLSSLSNHVKIVPMRDAETGTCIVEMPDEIIDASASTQLENIRQVIRSRT